MRDRGRLVRREPPSRAGEFTGGPRAGAMTTAAQVPAIALDETSGPALDVDREAVPFGAATHDIGRTLHPVPRAPTGTRRTGNPVAPPQPG
ncbi:hypothetical protein [Streptomyces sp. NPDC052015]|uniref:hypothetical protein n=1 Tax=Streptomyces sp. NPDC052015 TaxID=3154755 RepID=UPI0034497FB3